MRIRTQLQIIEALLDFCLDEQIPYRILTEVNLSTINFNKYKEKLIKMQLISYRVHEYHKRYKTTKAGIDFLKVLLRAK